MKYIIIITLLCVFSITGPAQTNPPLTLSLQQAMQMGLQNRFDRKADQFNERLGENQINQIKNAWIPEVHAEGNIQYNTQLQPTYVPKGFVGFTEPMLLSFGATNITAFGLVLNQLLYQPGTFTYMNIAKTNLALQKEKLSGEDIAIKNSIATAYLNVLLKKLQFKIAQDEENRFAEYETLAEGKYKHGIIIENDYLRVKLDFENAKVKTTTMEQNYGLAMDFLKYRINLPKDTVLILSDSIGAISFGTAESALQINPDQRTELKQLQLQKQESALNIKRSRESALPTISAVGYYAQLYQNDKFDYNASKWWAPHSYIGLKLTLPITGDIVNHNTIREQKIKQQQLAMRLQQTTSDINYQIQKAITDLHNAQKNMQSAQANYTLSQTIFKNQQQQFKIGVFSYSNLLDTEKSLSQSEQNYIQTVYEYMLAKLQYVSAAGSL